MGGGGLILPLYFLCICAVLLSVGVGAGLYWWGRWEEKKKRTGQVDRDAGSG